MLGSILKSVFLQLGTEVGVRLGSGEVVVLVVGTVEEYDFLHAEEGQTIGEYALEIRDTTREGRTAFLQREVPSLVEG